jgi:hypothetical protein
MFPPPSLHVGLMRSDPWNEFIGNGQTTADELLKFKSCSDDPASEMRQKVYEQLTVISGVGSEIPPPPTVTSDILSMMPSIDLPPVVSESLPVFLYQSSVITNLVAPGREAGPKIEETVDQSHLKVDSNEEETGGSLWSRVTGAWANLRSVGEIGVPSWFSKEQGLVVPTDPAIRGALGSIYGGTNTSVVITVRAIEAVDVPSMDWTGSCDPYVSACIVRGVGGLSAGKLELLPTIGSIKSSQPKFTTLNPKWNESIQLEKADLLSVISDSVLHLSMWDKDLFKTDDPIGFTSLSLVDVLQVGGVSPFPILPIQVSGSLIGPHAGIFVKIQLRMVQSVGVVSVTPVALQGFTRGWNGYVVRVDVKVTASDPIASSFYMADGLTRPESSAPATINETGHALWPKSTAPVTALFSAPKKAKPYLHLTLKTESVSGDAGQVAVRIGLLEKLSGITAMKLMALEGSPEADKLSKCSLYCGVECELAE